MIDLLTNSDFWRTVTLGFVAVGQTCFVVLYAFFPWYNSFLGRALFFKAVTLEGMALFAFMSRLWDFGGEDHLFIILYALLGVGVWAQFVAFLRTKTVGSHQGDGVGESGRAR